MPASRKSTSVRGIITSRICRSPASKTSSTIRRSSSPSVSWVLTSSRSSSSDICSLLRVRVTPDQAYDDVGGGREQPDHRPGDPRDPVDRRDRAPARRPPRAAARAAWARARRAPARGRRWRSSPAPARGCPRAPAGTPRPTSLGDSSPASVAPPNDGGEEPGQRDADLDRGEEPVGVLGEPRRRPRHAARGAPSRAPGSRAGRPAPSRPRRTCCRSGRRRRPARCWRACRSLSVTSRPCPQR